MVANVVNAPSRRTAQGWSVAAVVGLALASVVPAAAGTEFAPEVLDPAGDTFDEFLGGPATGEEVEDSDLVKVWFAADEDEFNIAVQVADVHVPGLFRTAHSLHSWEVHFTAPAGRFQAIAYRDQAGDTFAGLDAKGIAEEGAPTTANGAASIELDASADRLTMTFPRAYPITVKGEPATVSFPPGAAATEIFAIALDGIGSAGECDFCTPLDRTDPAHSAPFRFPGPGGPSAGPCGRPLLQGSASWTEGMNVNAGFRSFTVPAGSNQTLVVLLSDDQHGANAQAASSVSYDGEPLTRVAAARTPTGEGASHRIEAWVLASPPQGTHDLSVAWPSNVHSWAMAAHVYEGTELTTSPAHAATNTGSGTSLSLSFASTTPNSLIVGGAIIDSSEAVLTPLPPTTEAEELNNRNNHLSFGTGHTETGAPGDYEFGFASDVPSTWAVVAFELRATACQQDPPPPPPPLPDPKISKWIANIYICVQTPPDFPTGTCM